MKKQVCKQIRQLAATLPQTHIEEYAQKVLSGEKQGKVIRVNGQPVLQWPRITPINHENKMKDLFKKGGLKAVANYAADVIYLNDKFQAELANKQKEVADAN